MIFWRPKYAARSQKAGSKILSQISVVHFPEHVFFAHATGIPPQPFKTLETHYDSPGNSSPVLSLGHRDTRSFVDAVKGCRNGPLYPSSESQIFVKESVWSAGDSQETYASVAPSPVSVPTTPTRDAGKSRSVSPESPGRKVAQRKLVHELKGTQQRSVEAPAGEASKRGKRVRVDSDFVCTTLFQAIMAQESIIAGILKEHGAKKTKRQVLTDIMVAWKQSDDERINKLNFAQVNYYCGKIMQSANDMVDDELHERNVKLTKMATVRRYMTTPASMMCL